MECSSSFHSIRVLFKCSSHLWVFSVADFGEQTPLSFAINQLYNERTSQRKKWDFSLLAALDIVTSSPPPIFIPQSVSLRSHHNAATDYLQLPFLHFCHLPEIYMYIYLLILLQRKVYQRSRNVGWNARRNKMNEPVHACMLFHKIIHEKRVCGSRWKGNNREKDAFFLLPIVGTTTITLVFATAVVNVVVINAKTGETALSVCCLTEIVPGEEKKLTMETKDD